MKLLGRSVAMLGLLVGVAAGQVKTMVLPPVPANPYDPVTGTAQMLTTPAQRAAALNLLNQAGQNTTFGQQGGPDLTLSLALQSSGSLRYEGTGTMTEVWANGRRTWWANFDNENSGLLTDLTSNPVPLRLAQARQAVLFPLVRPPTRNEMRAASASLDGQPVTCVLVNRAAQLPTATGRDWREAEYCLDAAGRMLLYSPAPGLFYQYDYAQTVQYAGRTLAAAIHMIEGQQTVMNIQITQLGAPDSDELNTLQQSPRRAGILSYPVEEWHHMPQQAQTAAAVLQFTVGTDGRVVEAEVIGNGDPGFEQQALARLQHYKLRPLRGERVILVRASGQ
ncbi:MAG: energy transducer TonB [Terriglobales bacterium]